MFHWPWRLLTDQSNVQNIAQDLQQSIPHQVWSYPLVTLKHSNNSTASLHKASGSNLLIVLGEMRFYCNCISTKYNWSMNFNSTVHCSVICLITLLPLWWVIEIPSIIVLMSSVILESSNKELLHSTQCLFRAYSTNQNTLSSVQT